MIHVHSIASLGEGEPWPACHSGGRSLPRVAFLYSRTSCFSRFGSITVLTTLRSMKNAARKAGTNM